VGSVEQNKQQQPGRRVSWFDEMDDDLPNTPELSPLDSAQHRRAWRVQDEQITICP
jgi:hypothetical protein